jgi:hypothetical protein
VGASGIGSAQLLIVKSRAVLQIRRSSMYELVPIFCGEIVALERSAASTALQIRF